MSVGVTEKHLATAERVVAEARAHGGLAPVDLDRFWADQDAAAPDPSGRDIPQAPLGVLMSHECVFAELGAEEQWQRYLNDGEFHAQLCRDYNDHAEKIVGRRLAGEGVPDPPRQYSPVKGLHDVFEAESRWEGWSHWLMPSAHTEDELAALLDRVEGRDIRSFILPDNWQQEKARLTALGVRPPLYRGQRGPVTFAASIYGVDSLIYLILDNPDLAVRFRDAILNAMLQIARVLDEEAGYTQQTAPHGSYWADDNCCLLSPEMYELFGCPILKGVFDRYSPDPGDLRGQHSDSDMGHLLPILGRLGLTSVNFGPNVMIDRIREHLPRAVIHGRLAPFTFCRNEEANIVAEFLRDYDLAGDARGWVFATAGSINNGSRLTGMPLTMSAIQRYGRYDGR